MVNLLWNVSRDMYIVLLAILLIEQIPGADLLDENTRKVVVSITVVVVIVKVMQMLTESGGGKGPGRLPARSKRLESGKAASLDWASAEMQGWRPAMEDATCVVPSLGAPLRRHALFAVFDGHGGAEVSRIASEEFPKVLAACAKEIAEASPSSAEDSGGDKGGDANASPSSAAAADGQEELAAASGMAKLVGKALYTAMLKMDAVLREGGSVMTGRQPDAIPMEVRRMMAPSSEKKNAFDLVGSTAIIAVVEFGEDAEETGGGNAQEVASGSGARPLRVVVANCGDSRAVLCRGGRAVELSEDHKPELEGEEARIRRAGGCVARMGPCHRIDRWGLNLSRALGDFHYKARPDLSPEEQKVVAAPEIRTLELTDEDEFLVLGCDGVFELHTSQRVIDIVRQGLQGGMTVGQAAADLVDKSCSPNLMQTGGKGGDNCSAIVVGLPAAPSGGDRPRRRWL
mmetsp:Transcript_67156/g.187964  ORF Transcript_67156/g.187964 Transcript_67156/m.187964 type:complete len:458 (-) Transcript_67156:74-1447(-)